MTRWDRFALSLAVAEILFLAAVLFQSEVLVP